MIVKEKLLAATAGEFLVEERSKRAAVVGRDFAGRLKRCESSFA
jgi:hypothetical protein